MFGLSIVVVFSLGLFIKFFEVDFGWSCIQIVLVSFIVFYIVMFILLIQGYLVDWFGVCVIIFFCILLFCVVVGLMYFMLLVLWLYYVVWVVLLVIGIGIFFLLYLCVVSFWFDWCLGLVIGIVNVGIGIGGVVIVLFIGMVIV